MENYILEKLLIQYREDGQNINVILKEKDVKKDLYMTLLINME